MQKQRYALSISETKIALIWQRITANQTLASIFSMSEENPYSAVSANIEPRVRWFPFAIAVFVSLYAAWQLSTGGAGLLRSYQVAGRQRVVTELDGGISDFVAAHARGARVDTTKKLVYGFVSALAVFGYIQQGIRSPTRFGSLVRRGSVWVMGLLIVGIAFRIISWGLFLPFGFSHWLP